MSMGTKPFGVPGEAKPACRDALRSMLRCIAASDCVVEEGHTVRQCMEDKKHGVVTEGGPCYAYKRGYFECRRGQLDMRNRIRGQKFSDSA